MACPLFGDSIVVPNLVPFLLSLWVGIGLASRPVLCSTAISPHVRNEGTEPCENNGGHQDGAALQVRR
jgi:hypothetical protein